jgi:hypothetical protein
VLPNTSGVVRARLSSRFLEPGEPLERIGPAASKGALLAERPIDELQVSKRSSSAPGASLPQFEQRVRP